ncbi:MAG: 50S ribosomal protein L10 [Anaerolineae bacterium]
MAISRAKKEQLVDEIADKLARSKAVILTDYRGLRVTDINRLRNQLRDTSTGYHVVKNTLTKLALERAGFPVPAELFDGPVAIGFCYEDVVAPVKTILNFNKETGLVTIKGGFLGNTQISAQEIRAIAALPSRDVLVGQVVGGLRAPIFGLVNVLSGTLRGLLYVLQARARQLEGAEG